LRRRCSCTQTAASTRTASPCRADSDRRDVVVTVVCASHVPSCGRGHCEAPERAQGSAWC
jgi:hypothetical protein